MWQHVLLKLNAVISGLCALIYCLYQRRGHCGGQIRQAANIHKFWTDLGQHYPFEVSAPHIKCTSLKYTAGTPALCVVEVTDKILQ